MGIGTLKVSRYRYSVLAPKSNSVPVLGTLFKMYRLTFAVPVLFEKNVQYQSSTIGGKKNELHALFRLGGVLSRLRCHTCYRHSFKFCSCRRRNSRRLLIAERVVMNYRIFQGFNEVSNIVNGAFTLDI